MLMNTLIILIINQITLFRKKQLFAIELLLIDQVKYSEDIFNQLKQESPEHHQEVAVLANNIAQYYQVNNHQSKASSFTNHAQSLMQG